MTLLQLRHLCIVLLLFSLLSPFKAAWAEPHRFATVPALAVGMYQGAEVGSVHYIVIQLDEDRLGRGPTVLFSEYARGSAVGDEWKEGVQIAVAAAAQALREDAKGWTVTIKNRAYANYTNGASESSAIAVGLIAAWRGDVLRHDAVLTGLITADGRIQPVGSLPSKLEGAARANMQTILIPAGQALTDEWNLVELGRRHNMTVIEVETLSEAYEFMAGQRP
ncbi:MAG TPA: S16 family serine protease [Nitrospiraceae bacterium]|nr:S16 family serine protease [Nitrospiraceae bacterium]